MPRVAAAVERADVQLAQVIEPGCDRQPQAGSYDSRRLPGPAQRGTEQEANRNRPAAREAVSKLNRLLPASSSQVPVEGT
jgi:hypothetical protein